MGDVVVWFSRGAASAAALKLAAEQYPNVRAVTNPVKEEHEDGLRFQKDVEDWTGVKIESATNMLYPDNSIMTVFRERKYMSGIHGAPCTNALKKEARRQWEDRNQWDGYHIFGYTVEEQWRHDLRVADGMKIIPLLIEKGLTKKDCGKMVAAAGIKLPAIYFMKSRFGSGHPNANCRICVKATSATYYNHCREVFPEFFKELSELSAEIGCKLVRCHPKYLPFCSKRENGEWYDDRTGECLHVTDKNGKRKFESPRIYLHELPPDARGQSMKTMNIECGIHCGLEDSERRKDHPNDLQDAG